jgi:hypothetical protein
MQRLRPQGSVKLRIPVWLLRRQTGKRRAGRQFSEFNVTGSSIQDMESNSLEELSRIEAPEKPPSLEQLDELTRGRFSHRWLKYMYNRFKNVICPQFWCYQKRAFAGMSHGKDAICRLQTSFRRFYSGPAECGEGKGQSFWEGKARCIGHLFGANVCGILSELDPS